MMNRIAGKNIVMGMTGGIACYKAVDLISRLKKAGAEVDVILTEAAQEFITPLTVQTMAKSPCHVDMFKPIDSFNPEHISLAKKADLIVIAPATANVIGKIANGIADDFLTTVLMASRSKILIAPAMNTYMYTNPIFQENLKKLESLNYELIKPETGLLACGDEGVGKLEEPAKIMEYIDYLLTEKDLDGKKVVVTAGPTEEPIDPVRFITNKSSGKMGYEIAREAKARGAETILISGKTNLDAPVGVHRVNVQTTVEMLNAIEEYFDSCDLLIKAAAPADYRVQNTSDKKIKKTDENLNITLVENPDIAKHFGEKKGNRFIIGFAAETDSFIENAKKKIEKKNLNFIVLNDVTKEGAGFNADTNIVTIINMLGEEKKFPKMSKREVAKVILDEYLLELKK